MKLYDAQAPNTRRVRIFIAEKGIENIDIETVNLQKGEHRTPAFKAKNPFQKVPLLALDDGTHISESMAICRYLEELHPEPALLGRNALERAMVEEWNRRIELNLLAATAAIFRHGTPLFAGQDGVLPEWGEANKTTVQKLFHMFNKHLADNEFFVGDYFSVADITALCTIDFAKFCGVSIPEEKADLIRWRKTVTARPSAKA